MAPNDMQRPMARRIIDQLKSGTTPLDAAQYLDVGRDRWYRGMDYYFDGAEDGESKVRFIRGRYGDGKTHLMAMARHFALERGFVVSYASAENTPLNKLEEVYKRIVKGLQTKDLEGGIAPILRRWKEKVGKEKDREIERLRGVPELDLNFRIAVQEALRTETPGRFDTIMQWLVGEPIQLKELNINRYLKPGDSRDMMRSLSLFLRFMGYKGLLVLLDELDRIQNLQTRARQNCYQVLRELMDNTDGQGGMQGTLFYCAAPSEMFVTERGFREYDALRSRLEPAQRAIKSYGSEALGGQPRRVDYRATIIDLEETPLEADDLCEIAKRVRDTHACALGWDAERVLTDARLVEVVKQIIEKGYDISTPRLVATTIATIAELEEQQQEYNVDEEIRRSYDTAEEARAVLHRQRYED